MGKSVYNYRLAQFWTIRDLTFRGFLINYIVLNNALPT